MTDLTQDQFSAAAKFDWALRTLRTIADRGREGLGDSYPELVGVLAALKTLQPPAEPNVLSIYEQKAVLKDLMGLECLINYHDCAETGADAIEPGWGKANGRRALELLEIGRKVIAEDPELWFPVQKAAFELRWSEKQAMEKK